MDRVDILIIGGGAAGMAAAGAAYEAGCRNLLLVDRQESLGGILRQCLHRGFGSGLTGPEYIEKRTAALPPEIPVWCNATVLSVADNRTARICGAQIGQRAVAFDQLILATGCREIPMGALPIAGTRPEGIYTAGQLQEDMNLSGFCPQGPAVILGSGDLGLIMAMHLAEAGVNVTLVEQNSRCGGMARNQKCLSHPRVQLRCGVTVTQVFGETHIRQVQLSDGSLLPCKTLLIAVGLTPERQVIHGLGSPHWLHSCGNCRQVHPMVETVVAEGRQAGIAAWNQRTGKGSA